MPINNVDNIVSTTQARVGVCISGMEWNSSTSRAAGMNFNQGANLNTVTESMMQYYASIGITLVRVALMWEALQPVLYDGFMTAVSPLHVDGPGQFHKDTKRIIQNYLDWCDKYGMKLIIDIHNYGTYLDFNYIGPAGAVTAMYNQTSGLTQSGFGYYGSTSTGTAVFTGSSQLVTINSGTLPIGQPISFSLGSGGVLPPEVSVGVNYYVVADLTTTTGAISATPGGAAITFSASNAGTINRTQPSAVISKTFANGLLTQNHMNDLWTRIVQTWGSHNALEGYGLMNEIMVFNSITDQAWVNIANATITAIRAQGSNKTVYIDGPYANENGSPYTATNFKTIVDSANNWKREIHMYLDANRSGAYFDWAYDQIRGFCVDVPGVTGNVYRVGAARGWSLSKAAKLSGKPIFNGELGIPMTNDAYYEIAREYFKGARQAGTDTTIWGGTQSVFFPHSMAVQPVLKEGRILPHPTISAMLNDADVEDAKLVTYHDPVAQTIIVEAYGSLTKPVTIGISGTGTTFDKTTITLVPGVQRSGVFNYTPPSSATASVIFTFTSSRQATLPAPPSVERLNYVSDSSGSAAQGKLALHNTKSALYVAGTGTDFANTTPTEFESLVHSLYGWGDGRFGVRNLQANPNGRMRIVQGVNGRWGWVVDKQYAMGDFQADYLLESFQTPGADANSNYGTNPPHKANYFTNNSNWHFTTTFSATAPLNKSSNLLSLVARGTLAGAVINLNSTTLRLGLENNANWVYTQAGTPTVIAAGTIYTVTVTCVDGLVSLYINGVLECSASFTYGAALTSTSGAIGSSTLGLSSTSGCNVYAPITGVGIPPGTLIGSVSFNSNVTLVDANMQPVTLTATASGTYKAGIPLNSLGVLGNLVNFYPFGSADNVIVYSAAHGNGTLTATDIAGIAAFKNGITEPAYTVPVRTASPAITGSPILGGVLTVSNGTWTNSPVSYTYQWLRAGQTIAGATNNTYTVVAADVGLPVSCLVTAVNANGSSRSSLSAAVGAIFANSASSYNFNSDTNGAAPANIVSVSSALSVVNTGPAGNSLRAFAGQYMRDTQSTTQSGFNVHNLSKFTPVSGHSVTWQASANGSGILLMPQAGTTVSGYPGLLQGYLILPSSAAGTRIYRATAAGLVQLGTTSYFNTFGTNIGPPVFWKVSISRGVISVSTSFDGTQFTIQMNRYDTTFTSANAPIQLVVGGMTPNTCFFSGLSMETLA